MGDSMKNDSNPEEQPMQQSQSEGAEKTVKPTLSEVKKSWGFRRTTLARREFMEEVADVVINPPPVRRGRSRQANQTPQTTSDTSTSQMASRSSRNFIDDLEWSAPSSPVPEEPKPISEATAGSSLDPTLWQDFGSAFHTAFSLLGGKEGLSMEMSDVLLPPDNIEPTDEVETPPPQVAGIEVPDNKDCVDGMEISEPVAQENVEGSEMDDVVVISSQEEDSDEMTLIQIKQQLASKARQVTAGGRGGKGGRGRARGRGRGRRRAKGKGRVRGRGRGRATEIESSTADDDEAEEMDEVIVVHQANLLQIKESSPLGSTIIELPQSPAQQSSSDCIVIDTDVDRITDVSPGQYDDAPEEEDEEKQEEMKEDKYVVYSSISDSEDYDADALYCICRQKHNKRFMICCDSCQEWFHGDCVGVSETQGSKMERKGQEYMCPTCTTKKLTLISTSQPESQPEPELSLPESLTINPPCEREEETEERQDIEQTVVVEEEEVEQPTAQPQPQSDAKMEVDSNLPLCIGPDCPKHALPDSVYCGTECILQHAAATMKSLSETKAPQTRGMLQRKAAAARLTATEQRVGKVSNLSAGRPKEEGEVELQGDNGNQKEAASSIACDPSLTEVQATSIPSSNLNTASDKDSKANSKATALNPAAGAEDPSPEDQSTDATSPSVPVSEPSPARGQSEEKPKKSLDSGLSKKQSVQSDSFIPAAAQKNSPSPAVQTPATSLPRHHETGAVVVSKTSYVIPKKTPGPQQQPSQVPASTSGQKPSSAPTVQNETRNLPVPPAPIAPSSRPSQPNHQVRQSIQRSLTSILFKRVCDCEDLDLPESEVAKLVTNIEMEMFDIFRNTDSKYMNKYRTIMFNMKDPKNKGLLFRFLHGEISPFRLVRMSQKDMQAVKAPEPSTKETTEVKDTPAKATNLLQKPEAVKVDLPSLNPTKSYRNMVCISLMIHLIIMAILLEIHNEQKKNLPPTLKTRPSQPNKGVPDILTCMLKDTTAEHKTHLFDLKCKICTGLEKNRPNLLLGLAIIQKLKRPGNLPQEIEEKRPKVHMSKDPMWIPKPPVSGSMMDPIVQQYGQKSKVKKIEEEENEFDRPYDPEEEYDSAAGYGMVAPQSRKIMKADSPAPSTSGKDDVAYDPEDETIFEDFQSAESEDNRPRGVVIVKGTIIEVLQEGPRGALLHIHGDGKKRTDTEVKVTGQGIELETSLNTKVAIVKAILHVGILMDIEDPHHPPEEKMLSLCHQDNRCVLLLKSWINQDIQMFREGDFQIQKPPGFIGEVKILDVQFLKAGSLTLRGQDMAEEVQILGALDQKDHQTGRAQDLKGDFLEVLISRISGQKEYAQM
ncbi:uncharacterized protein LOC143012919 [Genypterus blacodes]|uniref:uncharacterized protein LOC143012919 n=1 Tax=Genypterus blacodes TaxID=154954 RepID=UPI003F76E554